MLSVKMEDGTIVKLPKPQGEMVQQLGLRAMYLNKRIDAVDKEEVHTFIDDIIYLILDFWKQQGVKQPFDRLRRLVEEDKLNFDNNTFKELFYEHVKEDAALVDQFKNGSEADRKSARVQLKKRGFIGSREVKTYDKLFLRKAGIDI